ncbi:MAG: hypothetical protein IKN12_05150 [Selenomonadaceae bacterium]|nr:hypothetical protein [Selenomonadaceae bacterium]
MKMQADLTPTPYEVIEQKEILHEAFAGLLADFYRFLDIASNNNKPNLLLLNEAEHISQNLFGLEYNTLEDMAKIKGKYELIKNYLEGMKSNV